jgi:hypothetical protein
LANTVYLGVVDRIEGKNNQYSYGKDYAIYYSCFSGTVYPKKLGIKGGKVNTVKLFK